MAQPTPAWHARVLEPLTAWFERYGAEPSAEIEARICGGVSATVFYAVLTKLRGFRDWSSEPVVEDTMDVVHRSGVRGTQRAGVVGVTFLSKEALEERLDVTAVSGAGVGVSIRFSVHREQPMPAPHAYDAPTLFRLKRRYKFERKAEFVFDLTEVRSGPNRSSAEAEAPVYEVEIEWIGQRRMTEIIGPGGPARFAFLAKKYLAKVQDTVDLVSAANAASSAAAAGRPSTRAPIASPPVEAFARVAGAADASRSAPLASRVVTFIALRVSDDRSLGTLLGVLNAELPLPSTLPHVKRVKRLPAGSPFTALVLLCAAARAGELGAIVLACGRAVDVRGAATLAHVVELARGAGGSAARTPDVADAELVDVVALAPAERAACEAEAVSVWPMVYFAPTVTAAACAGAPPSNDDALHFSAGLAAAARAAGEGISKGFVGNGAALFSRDAVGNWVERARAASFEVARAATARAEEHPFQSATLSLIATVAAADARARAASSAASVGEVPPRRGDVPSERKVFADAALGAKRRRVCDEDKDAGGAAEDLPAASAAATTELTYLLTGCDVFLTHEPGMMDAMALVHARAARVIFSSRAPPGEGALTGWGDERVRLHELRGLNHHFDVFERMTAHEPSPSGGSLGRAAQ